MMQEFCSGDPMNETVHACKFCVDGTVMIAADLTFTMYLMNGLNNCNFQILQFDVPIIESECILFAKVHK